MASSSIVFDYQYTDNGSIWYTHSKVNTHTFFCCEADCSEETHVSGGHCKTCLEEHRCSGDFDYNRGYYICDDADNPCCPQFRFTDHTFDNLLTAVKQEKAAKLIQRWWRMIYDDKIAFLKQFMYDYIAWEAGEIDDYGIPIPDDE